MKFSQAFEQWKRTGGYLICEGTAICKNPYKENTYDRYSFYDDDIKWRSNALTVQLSADFISIQLDKILSDTWQVLPTLP